MTKEEAINLLDNLIGMIEDNHNSDYDTAFKMAIKALEQGDVLQEIRQEIANLVKVYIFIDHKDTYVKEDEVLEIIDNHIKGGD